MSGRERNGHRLNGQSWQLTQTAVPQPTRMPKISNTVCNKHILTKPVFFALRVCSGIPYITWLGTAIKLVQYEASTLLADDAATHSNHILMFWRNVLWSYSRVNRLFFWDLMAHGDECSRFLWKFWIWLPFGTVSYTLWQCHIPEKQNSQLHRCENLNAWFHLLPYGTRPPWPCNTPNLSLTRHKFVYFYSELLHN